MFQNKAGAVLAVIGGVIGLATASGAFNGDKASTSPAVTYPASYGSQPYANPGYSGQPYANPGCYGGVPPTYPNQDAVDSQLQRMEEERINAEYEAKVAQIEAEQAAWDAYCREHPAVSYGNPYDQ